MLAWNRVHAAETYTELSETLKCMTTSLIQDTGCETGLKNINNCSVFNLIIMSLQLQIKCIKEK